MTLKVTFVLDDRDLKHFRREMRKARRRVESADEEEIISATEGSLAEIRQLRQAPDFVQERLDSLQMMIEMLNDDEWQLPKKEREHVLNLLVYFADPEDLIPDEIPGLGLLDDAIMIELALRQLTHDVDAYADFCDFREGLDAQFGSSDPHRTKRLAKRRTALLERIKRRTHGGGRSSLLASLWK